MTVADGVLTAADKLAAFGAGGASPYDHALRGGGTALVLAEASARVDSPAASPVDIARFLRQADAADLDVIDHATGAVLDIGCGPGRMVKAAILAGHLALGVDVSRAAVELARRKGLPVLQHSVFDTLPTEGAWGTALLLDGNIGIGGDPIALLERCSSLIAEDSSILVEAHSQPERDRLFDAVVLDASGRRSLPFPWAEVGITALRRYAGLVGLRMGREWTNDGRTFAECTRTRSRNPR